METQTQGWRGGQRRSVKDIGWQQGALRAARTEEHREYGWSNNKMVSPHHHFHSSLPPPRTTEWEWLREKKKTRLPAARDTVSSIQRSINKAEQTVLSARCDPSAFTVRSVCTHARTHARPALSQQRGRLPSFSSLLMSLPSWFYIHIWRHWAHFRLGGSDDERIISNVQKLPSSVAIDLEIWQKKKKDLWLFWGRLIMRLSVYFKRIYFIIVWTFSTHLC